VVTGRHRAGHDTKEQVMGKIVVTQFITVDGVIEDPGGSESHPRGGWAFAFERGEEGDQFKMDEVREAGALLLGRTTYEGFAAAWPGREGEFADKFNSMPKYVVSSTLENPEWTNTHVIGVDAVAGLRDSVEGDVLVNGSAQLVQELAQKGLVDEYRLMVFPTILGSGKRLFGDTAEQIALRQTQSRAAGQTRIDIYVPA
jgi:dihydrofolate reductase